MLNYSDNDFSLLLRNITGCIFTSYSGDDSLLEEYEKTNCFNKDLQPLFTKSELFSLISNIKPNTYYRFSWNRNDSIPFQGFNLDLLPLCKERVGQRENGTDSCLIFLYCFFSPIFRALLHFSSTSFLYPHDASYFINYPILCSK